MAKSADPDKAARQQAGLAKGRETMALRIAKAKGWLSEDFDPNQGSSPAPAKAPAKASQGSKPRRAKAQAKASHGSGDVIDYDEEPQRAPRKAGRRTEERPARRGGGFLDGLFGG